MQPLRTAEAGPSARAGRAADPGAPLFIVLNCGSGSNEPAAVRATIGEILSQAGREHHFSLVDDPRQLPVIARRAVSLAAARGGIVVAVGGDGTVNALVQATLGNDCPLGVLPQGTFNYFSRALGIPDDPAEATRVLLHGTLRPVQVGLVNDRVFVVNASLGLYPRLLEHRELYKRHYGRSRFVAVWAGLATLVRGHRQLRLEIEHQGERLSVRTPMLFVGNNRPQLERIGITEAAQIDEGQLVVVMPRPAGKAGLLRLGLRGFLGQLGEAGEVESFAFRRIRVLPSARWKRGRVKVATDGELGWLNAPLEFRIADRPVRVVAPAGPAQADART